MPRDSKPWYRKDRDAWFITINGRRFNLGPDRDAAHTRFHELMLSGGEELPVGRVSVFTLFDDFLEWTKAQRSPRTFEFYRDILDAFATHLKVDMPATSLRPYHLVRWAARHPNWSPTYQRNCLRAIQRSFRWAQRMGILDTNPLQFVEKPSPRRREEIVTPEQYPGILAEILSPHFKDLISAAWETGARPRELLCLEVRHVDLANSRWVFPPNESKIKTRHRTIYLNEVAARITRERVAAVGDGHLFRNRIGNPWQPFAVGCQFRRLKERIGRRLCLYIFRHSFATRMLTEGVDPMTVATLLGHSDTSMLGRVYQHLCQRPDHLLAQLNRASRSPADA